ncbi:MAG: hypothetical protein NTV80_05400 [Verrucomicrobia bacterium]|nr:hypothetical protein [Verrucomicrobiota bacterium]
MSFDPNIPAANADATSAMFRSQFNGLKALIDAVPTLTAAQVDSTNTLPQGSPANASVSVIGNTLHFSFEIPQGQEGLPGQAGQDGLVGPPFAQAVVDSVTTLNPWESASVGVSFDGVNVRFTFAIPRGNDGGQGPQGGSGSDGGPGPQGPPFAQAVVDGVTTLDPGQAATVQTSFDGSNVRFSFGIPRGQDGSDGTDGSQGPPGEVNEAMLSSAISNALGGTSNNTNGVSTFGQGADGSYNQQQMQDLINKVDELILNGRR